MNLESIPNFLKRVVYRADYRQLSSKEFMDIYEVMRINFMQFFDDIDEHVEFNNRLFPEDLNSNARPIRRQSEIYVFTGYKSDGSTATIKLSKRFVIIDIKPKMYNGKKVFFTMFAEILTIIDKYTEGIFKYKRISVRKYNQMMYKRNNNRNTIFSRLFYTFNQYENSKNESYSSTETISKNEFKVNIMKRLGHGYLDSNDSVNRLLFDYEIFCDQMISDLNNKEYIEILEKMNGILLEFYISTFRPDIYQRLVDRKTVVTDYDIYY